MQIGAPTTPTPGAGLSTPTARTGLAREHSAFSRIMSMAERAAGPEDPDAATDARARDAAEQLVAAVLVEPILKQLRETSQAAPPFAPTDGEKQFRSMLDARLAHEITSGARFPLVDRLARDLRSHLRTEAQTPTAART
ncbi:MAG: rod-binding protein [Phycisphaerales bacterium]|nr:rod-binding protein [Phycisphaerales bacterium]